MPSLRFFHTEEGQVCVGMISSPGSLAQLPSGKRDVGDHRIKVFLRAVLQTLVRRFFFLIWPGNHIRDLFQLIINEKG